MAWPAAVLPCFISRFLYRPLAVHPLGYRWLETAVVSESPTLTELADATNWLRVADRKHVPLAFLKHKL